MEKQSLKELRTIARNKRMKGYHEMRKKELIDALEQMKDIPEGVPVLNKNQLNKLLDSFDGMPTQLKLELEDWMDNNIVIKQRCKKSRICPHGIVEYFCKDCGGKGICPHNKQKAFCIECGGSQICEHEKQKSSCKDCKKKS